MPSAVPPLLGVSRLPARQVRAGTSGRYPAPVNGGETGDAYSTNGLSFGSRLTDPFGAHPASGFHHPRLALPGVSGTYSFRSQSLRSST